MRLLYVALLVASAAVAQSPQSASDLPSSGTTQSSDDELDEVEVTGEGRAGNRDDIILWLRQLTGRFRNEGTFGVNQSAPVTGMSECVGVGAGPGVHCVIALKVPGFTTNLDPGAYLLGVDIENPLVRYMTVDDTGAAVGTTAPLHGDTVRFRTPCKAAGARVCLCTTRITAKPGSDKIRFRLEIETDGRVTQRFDVIQTRVTTPVADEARTRDQGSSATGVRPRAQQTGDSSDARTKKMAELDAWLHRLVARFRGRAALGDSATIDLCAPASGRPGAICESGSQREVLAQPPSWFALDCNAIGSGSGVICLFGPTEGTVGPVSGAILFGVDPDRPGIRYLWIDGRGNAREAWGSLSGDTVISTAECTTDNCTGLIRTRIQAPSGNQPVEMYIEANVRREGSLSLFAIPSESRIELQRQPREGKE